MSHETRIPGKPGSTIAWWSQRDLRDGSVREYRFQLVTDAPTDKPRIMRMARTPEGGWDFLPDGVLPQQDWLPGQRVLYLGRWPATVRPGWCSTGRIPITVHQDGYQANINPIYLTPVPDPEPADLLELLAMAEQHPPAPTGETRG